MKTHFGTLAVVVLAWTRALLGEAGPTVPANLAFTATEETTFTGTLTATGVGAIHFSFPSTRTNHGTLTLVGTPNPGTFTYVPDKDWDRSERINYVATDSHGSTTGQFQMITTPVQDAPKAYFDILVTNQGYPAQIALPAFDPDYQETLSYSILASPAPTGTVALSGNTVTYTPPAGYGTDTFSFRVCDSQGACASAPIAVRVDPALSLAPGALARIGNDTAPNEWLRLLMNAEMRGITNPVSSNVAAGDVVRFLSSADYSGNSVGLQNTRIVVRAPKPGASQWSPSPAPTAPPASVNAKPIFDSLIAQAQAQVAAGKSVKIEFGAGTYHFRPTSTQKLPAILLSNLRDAEFGPSTGTANFVFHDFQSGGIEIQHSQRLKIKNLNLTYEYSDTVRGQTYGQVAYLGSMSAGCVTLEAGQSALDVADIGSVFSFDSSLQRFFTAAHYPHFVTYESGLTGLTGSSGTYCDAAHLNQFDDGETVLITHTRSRFQNAFLAYGIENEDITVDTVRLLTYPQMGFLFEGGRGVRIMNSAVTPANSDYFSGRADAMHFTGLTGDILVENNYVKGQGDDGLNIRGSDLSIAAFDTAAGTLSVLKTHDVFVRPGDRLVLLLNKSMPRHVVKVTSVTSTATRETYGLDWGEAGCGTHCQALYTEMNGSKVTGLKDVDGVSLYNRFGIGFNLSRASSRYHVYQNKYYGGAGRNMLLQAPNGVSEGNIVRSRAAASILLTSENASFSDGPGPVNVAVVGNNIGDAKHRFEREHIGRNGAIALDGPKEDTNFPVIQRILIKDNRFSNLSYCPVIMVRARTVEGTGNTYNTVCTESPTDMGESVSAEKNKAVTTNFGQLGVSDVYGQAATPAPTPQPTPHP